MGRKGRELCGHLRDTLAQVCKWQEQLNYPVVLLDAEGGGHRLWSGGHAGEEAARDAGHRRGTPELSSAGEGGQGGSAFGQTCGALVDVLFSSLSGALPPPSP